MQRDSRTSIRFIIYLAAAHFSHHVLTALQVPLLPFIRDDFGLNYAQAGMVTSAFTLAYGIGQLPSGWLSDRLGPRQLLLVGISGVAIAGALIGTAGSFALLIVFLVLMGLAGGGYHPAASALISGAVPSTKRGHALGLHVIGGSTSHFLAPLIAAGAVSLVGWRGTFLGLAVPVFIIGLLMFLRTRGNASFDRAGAGGDTAAAGEESEQAHPMLRIVVFLVLTGVIGAAVASLIAFLPLFMVDELGASDRAAAAFLSIIFSAGFFAAPLGGWVSDRLGRIRVMAFVGLATGPLFIAATVIPFGIGFAAFLLVIGVLMFTRMPTAEAFIAAAVPRRLRGTVLGIYFFSGMEGSALLTPLLGALIDSIGFSRTFIWTGLVIAGVTAGCVLLLAVTRPSGKHRAGGLSL